MAWGLLVNQSCFSSGLRACPYLLPDSAAQTSTPEMQAVRYKSSIAVSALLSASLLFMQLCVAVCAISDCLAAWTAPSIEHKQVSNHCHQTQPAANHHLPQPTKNNQHSCADHEAAVMLPVRNSLSAAVSLHLHPFVYEHFSSPLPNLPEADNIDVWDSLRSPPRIPQRSVLRI